jgi:hypothetical protein
MVRKYNQEWSYSFMEQKQAEMFQSGKAPATMAQPVTNHERDGNNSTDSPTPFHVTITDHHIIKIVSTYIQKLPDRESKKQLARIMINLIMKSANL